MRIAILTSARTGSTTLYHLIEEHLIKKNYTCISEPFNIEWREKINIQTYDVDFFENKENVFIKTFVSKNQKPISLLDNDASYWNWFFNYFEKVILLDRMDKHLQSESLTYHLKANDIHSWQKKQVYDLSNITSDEIEHNKNVLLSESNLIHSFVKHGYPICYYEDIYLDKDKSKISYVFDYIGIELIDTLYEKYINSDVYKIRLNVGEGRFKSLI